MRKRNTSVLLIGVRSKAVSLAAALLEQGYRVTAVNKDHGTCLRLSELDELTVLCGDGTTPGILAAAGAAGCDIAIALTGRDADNLVACQLCKKLFGVPKTVSLVADPKKTDFFYQEGVDSVVCAISAVTGIIQQQALIDELTSVFPVGKGQVQIMEVRISGEAPAAGKRLCELALPREALACCVLRADAALIPRGDTQLLAGDTLVVIVAGGRERELFHVLTGRRAM